jgi:DnaJ-class molecular chaperone
MPPRETKLYDILNVAPSSSHEEIRKSYKQLAKKHHPDRNKDAKEESEERFKHISMAYDILGDAEKRDQYDRGGLEAMSAGGGGGGHGHGMHFGMFSQMFGGGGGGGGGQNSQGPSKIEQVNIPLKKLYNNETINFRLKKQVICRDCLGIGAKSRKSFDSCGQCNGTGQILKIMQLGPGFMTQTQSQCDRCGGVGKSIKSGEECKGCNTKKVVFAEKKLSLELKNTFNNNHEVVFQGEGDQYPECSTYGDLVLRLNIINTDTFKKDGDNLLYTSNISLIDALCGFRFNITHLDGRILLIESNEIIKPNMSKVILGEGMNHNGNLIITFNVQFPQNKHISPEKKEYIRKLLVSAGGDGDSHIITENTTVCNMIDHVSGSGSGSGGGSGGSGSGGGDGGDVGVQPGIACAQQ